MIGMRDQALSVYCLEYYMDASIKDNYVREHFENPNSFQSRTGCVINIQGAPIHGSVDCRLKQFYQ